MKKAVLALALAVSAVTPANANGQRASGWHDNPGVGPPETSWTFIVCFTEANIWRAIMTGRWPYHC